MQKERLEELIKEFEKTCKDKGEARASALTALSISQAFNYSRSKEQKLRFLNQIPKDQKSPPRFLYIFPVIFAFLVIFGLVISVEASKPGEVLYEVKQASQQAYDELKKVFNGTSTEKEDKRTSESGSKKAEPTDKSARNESIRLHEEASAQNQIKETVPAQNETKKENQNLDAQKLKEAEKKIENKVEENVDQVQNVVENSIEEILPVPQNILGL